MKPELMAWEDLSHSQQLDAFHLAKNVILRAIHDGFPVVGLEEEIEKANKEADKMQTPWFFMEILLENNLATRKIDEMARANAQARGVWYIDDPEINIINLVDAPTSEDD